VHLLYVDDLEGARAIVVSAPVPARDRGFRRSAGDCVSDSRQSKTLTVAHGYSRSDKGTDVLRSFSLRARSYLMHTKWSA